MFLLIGIKRSNNTFIKPARNKGTLSAIMSSADSSGIWELHSKYVFIRNNISDDGIVQGMVQKDHIVSSSYSVVKAEIEK